MKTCYYDRATLAIADLVTPGAIHEGWVITRINVPRRYRGEGHGTALLKEILADADAEGADLWLDVSPSDGLDWGQLVAWYERHGFERVNEYGTMRRRPVDT